MTDRWTRKTAANFWNIKQNKIKYFVEYKGVGIVEPAERGEGQGNVTYFDKKNMVQIGIAAQLAHYGIVIGEIKKILDFVSKPILPVKKLPPNFSHLKPLRRGVLDEWQKRTSDLYLVLYPKPKQSVWPWIIPDLKGFVADKAYIEIYGSVLIIDLQAIFKKVREA